jgi:hypothetical protein
MLYIPFNQWKFEKETVKQEINKKKLAPDKEGTYTSQGDNDNHRPNIYKDNKP